MAFTTNLMKLGSEGLYILEYHIILSDSFDRIVMLQTYSNLTTNYSRGYSMDGSIQGNTVIVYFQNECIMRIQ